MNVCVGGIARVGARGREGVAAYDNKLYLAAYYLGAKDLQADLASLDGVLERLKRKVSREDLYYTWLANWEGQATNGTAAELGTCLAQHAVSALCVGADLQVRRVRQA